MKSFQFYIFLLISCLLLPVFVFATNTGSFVNSGDTIKNIDLNMQKALTDPISNVMISFCSGSNKNDYQTIISQPGRAIDSCIRILNNQTGDVDLYYSFNKAEYAKYGFSCGGDVLSGFLEVIKDDLHGHVLLSGAQYQILRPQLIAYTGGKYPVCFTVYVDDHLPLAPGEMFKYRVRKPLGFFITATGDYYNPTLLDQAKDFYGDNKILLLRGIVGLLAVWFVWELLSGVLSKKKKTTSKKNKK